MENEEWLFIDGYIGIYQVSNAGRVKRLKTRVNCRNNGSRLVKEKILKNLTNKSGYHQICLSVNSKVKRVMVHRLVLAAFTGNPENKPQVNHIDGNPSNNKLNNLEWCTPLENVRHAIKTGLTTLRCHSKRNVSLSYNDVSDIVGLIKNGVRKGDIASMYGVNRRTIFSVYCGSSWINHPDVYDMRKDYPSTRGKSQPNRNHL